MDIKLFKRGLSIFQVRAGRLYRIAGTRPGRITTDRVTIKGVRYRTIEVIYTIRRLDATSPNWRGHINTHDVTQLTNKQLRNFRLKKRGEKGELQRIGGRGKFGGVENPTIDGIKYTTYDVISEILWRDGHSPNWRKLN